MTRKEPMEYERKWFPLTGLVDRSRDFLAATLARTSTPVDPLTGPPLALAGRVVTMDGTFSVQDDAVVYSTLGGIVAVQSRT